MKRYTRYSSCWNNHRSTFIFKRKFISLFFNPHLSLKKNFTKESHGLWPMYLYTLNIDNKERFVFNKWLHGLWRRFSPKNHMVYEEDFHQSIIWSLHPLLFFYSIDYNEGFGLDLLSNSWKAVVETPITLWTNFYFSCN